MNPRKGIAFMELWAYYVCVCGGVLFCEEELGPVTLYVLFSSFGILIGGNFCDWDTLYTFWLWAADRPEKRPRASLLVCNIYNRIYRLTPQQLSYLHTPCMKSRRAEKGWGEIELSLKVPPLSDHGLHLYDNGGSRLSWKWWWRPSGGSMSA